MIGLRRPRDMAGATALDVAGHHVVAGSGVCPKLLSRSHSLTGFGGNRFGLPSSSKNSVSCGPTRRCRVQALLLEPSDGAQDNLDDFVRRMEQTWSITKVDDEPSPIIENE